MMNNINERIVLIADYYGIKKASEFARRTGFSHQVAFNYLNSNRRPNIDAVKKICQTFDDINPEWILTGDGPMLKSDKQVVSIKSQKKLPNINIVKNTGAERIKMVMDYFSLNKTSFSREIGLIDNSTIAKIISEKRTPNTRTLKRITDRFPEINPDWILTGRGEMLRKEESDSHSSLSKAPQLRYGQLQSSTQSLNNKGRGVPFYDVDFIGGFQYIFNDQTVQPLSYIDIPIFNEADAWVNVTGDSMKPFINSGDIVAIKKLINWNEFILYGEIYGIVTEDFRTIKIIKEEEEGCFLLTPYNQSQEFKAQRIPKNLIMHIFKVIGCVKRIF